LQERAKKAWVFTKSLGLSGQCWLGKKGWARRMRKSQIAATDRIGDTASKTIALFFTDSAALREVVQDSSAHPIATHDGDFAAALVAVQSAQAKLASAAEAGLPLQHDVSAADNVEVQPGAQRALQGKIDKATRTTIEGWVWDPETPEERVRLELVEGETTLATAVASNHRLDIVKHGIGDGRHGFSINLRDGLLLEDCHVLHLRCADTGAVVPGSPIILEPADSEIGDQPGADDRLRFQGHLDSIDAEWRLCGWAYDPSGGEPLTVELVEDGSIIASAQATEFRPDLLEAGFGQGACAFYINMPSDLFHGGFHNLRVYGVGAGHRELVGKPFGIVLPRLGRRHGGSQAPVPAIKIFEQITETHAPTNARPGNDVVREAAAVLQKIGFRFGHSAALGLLYAYVLRRSIDKDGLVTRLTRIHSDPSEYEGVVKEVIFSQEAAMIHGPSKYLTLHPLEFLSVWLDKKFGILELPE
jgi:hypothetical protein